MKKTNCEYVNMRKIMEVNSSHNLFRLLGHCLLFCMAILLYFLFTKVRLKNINLNSTLLTNWMNINKLFLTPPPFLDQHSSMCLFFLTLLIKSDVSILNLISYYWSMNICYEEKNIYRKLDVSAFAWHFLYRMPNVIQNAMFSSK